MIRPKGSTTSACGLFGHPGALIIGMRHMRHEIFDRFLLGGFPGSGDGKNKAPAAYAIGLVPLLDHGHVGLGTIGRIPAHDHQRGPTWRYKLSYHLAKQGIFTAIPGMALRQNEPHPYRDAIAVPCRHQQDEAQAKKPGMMLADPSLLRHGILGAAFVDVAAIAKQIQGAVRRCWQGGHEILRQPTHEEMHVPIGGFEQAAKAPRGDGCWGPPGHLLQGVWPRVHGLHEHQPAEDEAMTTTPYSRHATKYQGHKPREVGEGQHHTQHHPQRR